MLYTYFYYKKEKRIPIFLALIPIFLVVFLTSLFFLKRSAFKTKAKSTQIKKMVIGNITNQSATIYWFTNEKETGWIIYGKEPNKLDKLALDERDLLNNRNEFKNHYVILKNLLPNTKYYFMIVTNNKLFSNKEEPFFFKTLSERIGVKNTALAYGKVVDSNNNPEKEAVVNLWYVEKKKKNYFLGLTKSDGSWLIPIPLEKLEVPKEVQIEIINEKGKSSSIIANINKINPLPELIIIGKNYSFLEDDEKKVLSAVDRNFSKNQRIEIFYPLENAVIPGRMPLIKGRALSNSKIDLLIEGEKFFSANLKSDANGLWSYLIPNPLPIGFYKLKIITKDVNNNDLKLERKFKITGDSGSSVLGTATPSATIFPTFTPTPTSPAEETLNPTFTPTPTPVIAGNSLTGLLYPSLIFIFLGLGLLLVF